MQDKTTRVVLTGPYAGKTMVLNRHHFTKGVALITGQPDEVSFTLAYLARSYQAYPEGSPELEAALSKVKANGVQHHFSTNPQKQDGAPNTVQGEEDNQAGQVPDPRELQGERHADGSAGNAGLVPGGAGHENAGLGEGVDYLKERESSALTLQLQNVIKGLDPKQDTHWTPDGFPALDTVAEGAKQPSLTRADVEAAVPGWTRVKAAQVAAIDSL